jgi:hypothetical protein
MKKVSRIFAIVLCLAIVLSVTAFANWTQIGSNTNHNGVVTSAPTTAFNAGDTAHETYFTLPKNGSGWDGVDTVPVMRTVGTGTSAVTYAYVLYDGYNISNLNGGGRVAKINCNTGALVWSHQISKASGMQLSSPLLVPGSTEADDVLYVAAASSSQVLPALDSGSWTKDDATLSSSTVSVSAGSTVTLSTSGYAMASTPSNRVAMGIYIGTSASTSASATVTWNVNGTTGSKSFSSSDLLQDGDTGRYYFYLNENIGAITAASPNTITYTVTMSGAGGTIEYAQQYQHTGAVQAVTGLNSTDGTGISNKAVTAGTAISGQINTPITYDGTYIYFGTWSGSSGTYYQVDVTSVDADGDKLYTLKSCSPGKGFYWAGAVKVGNFVYFGSDGGTLYGRKISNFNSTAPANAKSLDLTTIESGAGNIRSAIMTDGTYLYFTSQGGFLWCILPDSNGNITHQWHASIGGTSTSTPTKVGDRIYVGYYSGFSAGGVQYVSTASGHAVTTVASGFPVQSSIVVKGSGTDDDYLYFVTNAAAGAGYCFQPSNSTSTPVWKTTSGTYALGGMAIENGYAVFGNERDQLFIVK